MAHTVPSSLSTLAAPDGTVATDPAHISQVLLDYWSIQFSEAPVCSDAVRALLGKWCKDKPQLPDCWLLTWEEWCEVLDRCADSTPGPDGLPYSVWRLAPECARRALYAAYASWLSGEPVPHNFAEALMVFIPKPRPAGLTPPQEPGRRASAELGQHG